MQSFAAPMRRALASAQAHSNRAAAAAATALLPATSRAVAAAAAQPRLASVLRCTFSSCRSFHSTPLRFDDAEAEAAEVEKQDVAEIGAFLSKLKLGDHAEKFTSFQHMLNVKSRELKEMGLTVKQRKTLLKLLDRYKTSLRVRRANALIYAMAHKISPEELQARVYRIMYAPIYAELDWRDENRRIEAAWRVNVTKFKDDRRWEHNNLRGLREPELQEMAKLEARLVQHELSLMQKEQQEAEEEERRQAEQFAAERADAEGKAAAAAAAEGEGAEAAATPEEVVVDATAKKAD